MCVMCPDTYHKNPCFDAYPDALLFPKDGIAGVRSWLFRFSFGDILRRNVGTIPLRQRPLEDRFAAWGEWNGINNIHQEERHTDGERLEVHIS